VLEAAEKLPLQALQRLSDYVDVQMHPLTRSLLPDSLLAQAETIDDRPPLNAAAFLRWLGHEEAGPQWKKAFEHIVRLHAALTSLSHKQRELIAYVVQHGSEGQFGRMAIGIQTLEQKLKLSHDEMRHYFSALEDKGLLDIDDEHFPINFELSFGLGHHDDAFTMLKGYLGNPDQCSRALVECDFTVFDE
jgi:hypothetical protein